MATVSVRMPQFDRPRRKALKACADALRQVADYRLPRPLQRKLQRMLEQKESLSEGEHEQVLTLVEAAHERSLQRVKSQMALKLLLEAFPHLDA